MLRLQSSPALYLGYTRAVAGRRRSFWHGFGMSVPPLRRANGPPHVVAASQLQPAPERRVDQSASRTTFQSQTDRMQAVSWTRVGSKRDWQGEFHFFRADAPRETVETPWGVFHDVVVPFGDFGPERCFAAGKTNIVDARTHLPEGKNAWSLEKNGFCFVARPAYNFEDHLEQVTLEINKQAIDHRRVNREFAPDVLETVRAAAGAKRAFWLSHMRRGEPSVRQIGIVADGYVLGFPHSDYGPDNEAQFRQVLQGRFGLEEEEAKACGLCLVNFWAPVNRPAFRNPLAYLDCSTVKLGDDSVRYLLDNKLDTGYTKGDRPLNERVPVAAKDCPALGPVHSSKHRWVYLSDMTEEEAVIFKQYDFRPDATSKATFHQAFPDPHHDSWEQCPPRRSIECRILLVYEPEPRVG